MVDYETIFNGDNEVLKQAIRDQHPDMVPDWAKNPDPAKMAKREFKLENDLQEEVENWLHLRGYWRRSPLWIKEDEKPKRGWQIHLHETKKNPIMGDILLLGNDGRYLEFELKRTNDSKWSSLQQRILCQIHGVRVWNDFRDVIADVLAWENAA